MAAAKRSVWLFSPPIDMLFGYGGLYLLLVLALLASPMSEAWVAVVTPWLVLAISTPHYGATLVRVYGSAENRRKYRFFTIWVTLAVIAAFVAATRSPRFASWFWTIQVMWGLWHYSAQNYGVSLMALGRGGVQLGGPAKRVLRSSFVLATVVALIPFHIASTEGPRTYTAAPMTAQFVSLDIPQSIGLPFFWIAVVSYAACALGALVFCARKAPRLADLAPTATLMAAQAVWFAVPAVLMNGRSQGPSIAENPALAMIWVAAGHAVQYLWITSYFARKSENADPPIRFFGRALAAGGIAWFLAPILFAPGALGTVPYELGLALAVSAAVNIHHYILDGVIWKLRDGRLARILINSEAEDAAPPRIAWSARTAVGLGLALVALEAGLTVETNVQAAAIEAKDADRLERAVNLLSIAGRDSPKAHITLGQLKKKAGDYAGAAAEFEAANRLFATPIGWVELGLLREETGDLEAALSAYRAAAELDADLAIPLVRTGIVHLKRGARSEAASWFERAQALEPENRAIADLLARARATR